MTSATPATLAALSNAARNGVLIKGGLHLEQLADLKAIAKVNDIVVFVPFVVPGDVVDLQVTRKKSHFMEARPIHFHSYSDKREEAFCEHYGKCGGCKWQILPYEEQIRYKQKQVVDNSLPLPGAQCQNQNCSIRSRFEVPK